MQARFACCLLLLAFSGGHAFGNACTGHSLLGELQRDRPDVWAEANRQFAAVPNGTGIFWRVEKEGVPTSWLFGTMHVPDPRVLALKPAVQKAFASANSVVLESVEVLGESQIALAGRIAGLIRLPEGQSFDADFSPGQKAALGAMTQAIGMPYFAARRLKPWFLAMALSIPSCIQAAQLAGEPALDKKLYDEALAQGKALIGLETADEQMDVLRAFDRTNGTQALLDLIPIGPEGLENLFMSDIDLYLQDRPAFGLYLSRGMPEFRVENENFRLVENSLLHDRNRRMRERLLPILAKGSAFVGVGALHLIGEDGLIELLRQSGYRITRDD